MYVYRLYRESEREREQALKLHNLRVLPEPKPGSRGLTSFKDTGKRINSTEPESG